MYLVPGTHRAPVCLFCPQTEKPAAQREPTTPHTVKLRGAPFNVTEVCATPWGQGQGARREGGVPGASAAWGSRTR